MKRIWIFVCLSVQKYFRYQVAFTFVLVLLGCFTGKGSQEQHIPLCQDPRSASQSQLQGELSDINFAFAGVLTSLKNILRKNLSGCDDYSH